MANTNSSAIRANDTRPMTSFHPSPWGDYFLNYLPYDEETLKKKEEEVKEIEMDVKMKLKLMVDKMMITMAYPQEKTPMLELLNFIDVIERLGMAYRLEEEIEQALHAVYDTKDGSFCNNDIDLYHTSLWFRLLRQHGFHVSCDVFNKFKDQDGTFKNSLLSDVNGILALYEASHVRIHGDDTLDEAMVFTETHMNDLVTNQPNHPLASQVKHALLQPYHKGMPRLESRHFITFYEQCPSHDKKLLKYAKLDFNRVQALHKKELRDLSRWWKDLGLTGKMPFSSRDRVPEAYFWTLGPYFEPQYAIGRKIYSHVFKIISIIDDIYDAYATIDELTPFTEAIERWDRSCSHKLPEYMKVCYEALIDIYEEFERDLAPEGRSWCVEYARTEMKEMCKVYYQEAKWCHEKYTPTCEEYLEKAAIISFGNNMGTVVSFLGMGNVANEEAFKWARGNPNVIRASGIIGRLMDDMASHQFEQGRNHVSSAVQCYMREHEVKVDLAHKEFEKRVDNCWKEINEMMLKPYEMPKPLLTRILNSCCIVDVIYKGEDCYTFSNHTMKNHISLILTDPIPMDKYRERNEL